MNRRQVIKGIAAGCIGTAGAGVVWLNIDSTQSPLNISFALTQLDQLIENTPTTSGEWNIVQMFNHCAQSVEYSMTGYPEHKSALFKNTVGKAAFSVFAAKRKMTHALNEPIPGAPELVGTGTLDMAVVRFRQSLIDFESFKANLQPHFAYGPLTKQEYEAAHVMHFFNHLSEVLPRPAFLTR